MNYAKLFFKNSIYVVIGSALSGLLFYLLRIYLARNLGPKEYGLFFAVYAFIFFLAGIRELGLNASLGKHLHLYGDNKRKKKGLILVVLYTQITLSCLLFLMIYFLRDFLAVAYFKDILATDILLVLGGFLIANVFVNLAETLYSTYHKQQYRSAMMVGINAVLLGVSFLLVPSKGALAPAIAYLIGHFMLGVLFSGLFFGLYFRDFFQVKAEYNKEMLSKLFIFGITVVSAGIGSTILTSMDTLVLTHLTTLEDVGLYNTAVPLVGTFDIVIFPLIILLFPLVAELIGKKDTKRLHLLVEKVYRLAIILVLPLSILLFAYAELIIKIFFGEAFLGAALPLKILVLGKIGMTLSSINSQIMGGMGEPKHFTIYLLFAAIINLVLNFALIPIWGISGAAIATAFSYLVVFLFSYKKIRQMIPTLNFPPLLFFKGILVASCFLFAVLFLKKVLTLNMWVEMGIVLAASSALYAGLLLATKIVTAKEIQELYGAITRKEKSL